MIIPYALANRLNVFQEGDSASLQASPCFFLSPHLLAPNPPFGHLLRTKYHNFVNPMDRLKTVEDCAARS